MTRELELAQAFAGREAWAYEAAYREHGGVLYAAAWQLLRDDAEAQDCVHDVLLRLWRRGDAYRPERGALRAFLAVSVRNEALARLRSAQTRARIAPQLAVADSASDVAAAVTDREALRGAMTRLTRPQRAAIELAYFEHLTHPQIAQRLGEPVGTVKSRISGALRRLREIFLPEGEHDAG